MLSPMPSARWRTVIFSLGLALAALAGGGLARSSFTPITTSDVEQARYNVAAPLPRSATRVGQTFVPLHNGLSSIELLAVVYPDGVVTETVTLRLLDAEGREVAARTFNNPFRHNDPLRLTFTPQSHSAGQTYTLWLEGSANNQITAWAYALDGYVPGAQLTEAGPATGDLRFITTYTYLWPDIVHEAVIGLGQVSLLAPMLWLVLFAPGQLALIFLFPKSQWPLSFGTRAGLALALSLSLVSLTWLWISVVGLRWSALTLGGGYGLVGLSLLGRAFYIFRRERYVIRWTQSPAQLALLMMILLALITRLLAIRDLAAPLWVDSSHHLLIARVLAETGHVPANYQPVLPVDRFYYHWGYHVLLVSAHWLARMGWPQLMLVLGQVLNALMPLAVYAGTELLTRRPRAGVVAAFVVALLSFFPSYYLSWGRYTQLVGLLILAPLVGLLWYALRPEDRWAAIHHHPHRGRLTIGLSLLVAGLILAHYRVSVFWGVLALVALACGGRQGWKGLGWMTVVSGLLTLPWLIQLFQQAVLPVLATPARLVATGGYNDFPVDYFRGDLERGWLIAAMVAVGWGLIRRERALWVLGGWAVVMYALLNIGPGTWLVNNNAWAISLFLPGAMAVGWGADQWLCLGERLQRWFTPKFAPNDPSVGETQPVQTARLLPLIHRAIGPGLRLLFWMVFTSLLIYAGLRGLLVQINIANPVTRLVTAEDLQAVAWVEHNTSPEALLAVSGWKWLGNAWAGSDGGAWLWPLTGRRTTLPPVDYLYQADWAQTINAFNEKLVTVTDATTPEALALLREMNVTHIFIGAKGGSLKPEMFLDSPHYRLLYTNGAAWVFELTGD